MALAIAQGVLFGTDLRDGQGKIMTVDWTKTTLPQAGCHHVGRGVDERAVLLREVGSPHAVLLIKLAEDI